MKVEVFIEGDAEVMRRIAALQERSRNVALLRMGNAAGAIVRTQARAMAPRDTGSLRESLAIKVLLPTEKFPGVTVIVGPSKKYAKFLTRKATRRGAGRLKTHTAAMKMYRTRVTLFETAQREWQTRRKISQPVDFSQVFARYRKSIKPRSPYLLARKLVRAQFPGVRVRVPVRYAHIVAKRPGPGHRFLQRAAERSLAMAKQAMMQQAAQVLARV